MPKKPEDEFKATLAKQYPGMGGEMRRGIVGIAIRCFITPGEIAPKEPLFTEDELLWIANAAGVDTGTSNIRPEGGLSGQGLLVLRNKLAGMVPCRKG